MDLKLILDSIPVDLVNAAIAVLPDPKQQNITSGGVKEPHFKGDEPVMVQPGWSDLTTVEAAFDSIVDLTKVVTHVPYRQSYLGVDADVGIVTGMAFATRVLTAIANGNVPEHIDTALKGVGIDITDPQVTVVLDSLVDNDFTQEMADAIMITNQETVSLFPRLSLGHVQTAIYKKATGEL